MSKRIKCLSCGSYGSIVLFDGFEDSKLEIKNDVIFLKENTDNNDTEDIINSITDNEHLKYILLYLSNDIKDRALSNHHKKLKHMDLNYEIGYRCEECQKFVRATSYEIKSDLFTVE